MQFSNLAQIGYIHSRMQILSELWFVKYIHIGYHWQVWAYLINRVKIQPNSSSLIKLQNLTPKTILSVSSVQIPLTQYHEPVEAS